MAALNRSAYLAFLKEIYKKGDPLREGYQQSPLLGMVSKKFGVGGSGYVAPVTYSHGGSASATFSTAQTNGSKGKRVAWNLTNVELYNVARVNSQVMDLSQTNEAAFAEAFKEAQEDAIFGAMEDLSRQLYKSGWGDVGVIAAGGISGDVITLTNKEDTINFEVGMKIVASATLNSSVLRTGSAEIVATDTNAGTVEVDAIGNITGIAAGDTLFREGSREDSASPTRLDITGLDTWLPATAPSDTLFGVSRGASARLGGLRFDGSSLSREEAIKTALAQFQRVKGKPTAIFMNSTDWDLLEQELQGRIQYETYKDATVNVGFKAIMINTVFGALPVYADPWCQVGVAYALNMPSIHLVNVRKQIVSPIQNPENGSYTRFVESADEFESRYVARSNLLVQGPGLSGRIILPNS